MLLTARSLLSWGAISLVLRPRSCAYSSPATLHSLLVSPQPKYAPVISWTAGWFSVAGWWALMGTAGSLGGSIITGMISLVNPGYVFERWHLFLLYTGITLSEHELLLAPIQS